MYSRGKGKKNKRRRRHPRDPELDVQPPNKRVRVADQFEQEIEQVSYNSDHIAAQATSSDMFGFVETTSLSPSRAQEILEGIQNDQNEGEQLQCTMELCSFLSLSTEDSVRVLTASMQPLINGLVHLLRDKEHNPEIMLLSVRSLTHLLDVLPSVTGTALEAGIVPVLCEKLLNMQFIDLAEQSIKAMEKIAQEAPQSLLDAGALGAVLTFIDFFPMNLQRTAVTIAAYVCRQAARSHNFDSVRDNIPTLTNFLNYSDPKIIQNTCRCISSLAMAAGTDSNNLELLWRNGLISSLVRMLSSDSTELHNLDVFKSAIDCLASVVKKSPDAVLEFINQGGIHTIAQTLSTQTQAAHRQSQHSPSSNEKERTKAILSLILHLLPEVPSCDQFVSGMSRSERESLNSCQMYRESTETLTPSDQPLNKLYIEHPEMLSNMAEMLLSPLLQIQGSSMGLSFQHYCFTCIAKVIYFSPASVLERVLRDIPISTFLATLLTSSDMVVVSTAIQICIILIERLPIIFSQYFTREGVLNVMKRLAESKTNSEKEADEPLCLDKIFGDSEYTSQADASHSSTPSTPNKNVQSEEPESPFKKHLKSPISPSRAPELQTYAIMQARQFQQIFKQLAPTEDGASSSYKNLCKIANTFEQSSLTEAALKEALVSLCDTLFSQEGVSTFELMHSGIVDALIFLLLKSDLAMKNLVPFLQAMGRPILGSADEPGLTYLVGFIRKLQQLLESVDNLPIILGDWDRTFGSHIFARHASTLALRPLLRPIQLSIKIDSSQSSPISLAVSPLTRIETLERYISRYFSLHPETSGDVEDMDEESETSDEDSPEPVRLLDIATRLFRHASEAEEDFRQVDTHEISLGERSEMDAENPENERAAKTFVLELNGNVLLPNMSLFHALYRFGCPEFSHLEHPANVDLQSKHFEIIARNTNGIPDETECTAVEAVPFRLKKVSEVDELAQAIEYRRNQLTELPNAFENHEAAYHVIIFLSFLHDINSQPHILAHKNYRNSSCILDTEFQNAKLSQKVMKQLQDPVLACASCLPPWCQHTMSHARFLYPFHTRRFFFTMNAMNSSRALVKLQESGGLPDVQIKAEKTKIRVSRERLLECTLKLLDEFGNSNSILEIEFAGEVGTGLGPTLEFYTLASREFQRADLNLWVDDNTFPSDFFEADREEKQYVQSGELFPRPISHLSDSLSSQEFQAIQLFKKLGLLVARSLLDERLTDLPLSKPFLKCLLGQTLSFSDIQFIKPMLYETLSKLREVAQEKLQIEEDQTLSKEEKEQKISNLKLDEASVEDLCLDFTLPGFPDVSLVPNGREQNVDIWNLQEWIQEVIHVMLEASVQKQINAFKQGFSQLIPLEALHVFSVDELEEVLCGSLQDWNLSVLIDGTICDHGYSHNSRAVQFLFEVLLEMTQAEKRMFLRFVTGSPKLPVGGLKTLNPRLTIVPSKPEEGQTTNDKLPSVMTCANYLKLPDYTSKEILRERLLLAIVEGQQSFHLT